MTGPAESHESPRGVFLTASWRHLVMLNYEIDPAVLGPLVPRGTALDAHGGRFFASMVGFMFEDTRVLGVAVPFHRTFEEVNLRFYVRREAGGTLRRGVVFVKEIVPRRAIAAVARLVYGEKYEAMPMDHRLELPARDEEPDAAVRASYRWRHGGRWNELALETEGRPSIPVSGSHEEFITEHYWGYARTRRGGTVEYRVEHPQWRVWRAAASSFDCDVAAVYGSAFVPALSAAPASAFLADGSDVLVRRGTRLAARGA